jgi:glycosyltransferase involved in cell wall biosynthesis
VRRRPRLLFLVNDDAFFASHRLEIGVAARRAGLDVMVAAGGGGGARAVIEGAGIELVAVDFDRGGRSAVRDAATLAAVARLYGRVRPTIVHHVTIKPVLYGSVVARTLGIPVVVNAVSGLGFAFLDRSRRGRVLRAAIETAYRAALDHPRSTTIFQNEDDRGHFVARRLVRPERATLVRGSGVDVDLFAEEPLRASDPLVVLPARLLWDKGVGEFVEAARLLRARRTRARFALVGAAGGTNPASVPRALVDRWVNEGVVEWWGHRADMPQVLAEAHFVVLPSYREGLPLALLEAASVGRACVTTDAPGCRDAVEDGVTGWVVPARDARALADAIDSAVRDRDELARRGAAAAARARRAFDRRSVVRAHLDIYRELLGAEWPGRGEPEHAAVAT